jgi:hypothetical protein
MGNLVRGIGQRPARHPLAAPAGGCDFHAFLAFPDVTHLNATHPACKSQPRNLAYSNTADRKNFSIFGPKYKKTLFKNLLSQIRTKNTKASLLEVARFVLYIYSL